MLAYLYNSFKQADDSPETGFTQAGNKPATSLPQASLAGWPVISQQMMVTNQGSNSLGRLMLLYNMSLTSEIAS